MLGTRAHTIAVYIAFALLTGWLLWQSSQYPQPMIEYRGTATEEHGTSRYTEEEKKRTDEALARYTGWLTFFTGILALATVGLGVATIGLYLTGEKAANAADRSTRAAIGLQLPIIRVTPDKLGYGETIQDGIRTENCSVYVVAVSNLGTTKAFPKEIIYGYTFGDTLPDEPSYTFGDKFGPNTILEPGPDNAITKKLWAEFKLEAGQRAQILKGNCLWFYCVVLYDDFMDEPRSHGFCWRWSYVGGGLDWRVDATPAYNRKT